DFFTRLARLSLQRETGLAWGACLRPPRGGPVDVDLTVTVVPGPEGRPAGLRWLVRDVTARRAAEEALRAEKAFSESLIETAQALVLVLSAGGELLRTNA